MVLTLSPSSSLKAVFTSLIGIRQIKFSALEKQWEDRIFDVRQEELKTLKRVFISDTLVLPRLSQEPINADNLYRFLIACWMLALLLVSIIHMLIKTTEQIRFY